MDSSKLKTADLLLTAGDSFVSTGIKIGSLSIYSHVALYVGNGMVIEAEGDGVQERSLEASMGNDVLVHVYRRNGLKEHKATQVADFARTQLNKRFDHAGVALAGPFSNGLYEVVSTVAFQPVFIVWQAVRTTRNNYAAIPSVSSSMLFCAELVALSFEKSGVPIVGYHSQKSTPQDLTESDVVRKIGSLKDIR